LSRFRNTEFEIELRNIRWKIVAYVETFGMYSATGSGWIRAVGGDEFDGGENVA
jgi:hypothetical protein